VIDVDRATATLQRRYGELSQVSTNIFKAVETYHGNVYAVRFFDLRDNLVASAKRLTEYQDELLGIEFFNPEARADLRWNNYLYFVTNSEQWTEPKFLQARAEIEANREYARKQVISENDLDNLVIDHRFGVFDGTLPPDPLTIWTGILNEHRLAFVIDDSLGAPAIVRHIESGETLGLAKPPEAPELEPAEAKASTEYLGELSVQGFRAHPSQRTFLFGDVNLIVGPNGVGKTSLLEAVEYLFCGTTRRGGKIPARTVISGTLRDSKTVLSTKPATPPARFRARHLAWYQKAELRKITLDDSFSKFNFLDTDAAVRLSVEDSKKRISEDLTQLLLGTEAVKALDKLHRVQKELVDARKLALKDTSSQELRSSDARRRADEIRKSPERSDQLFQELLGGLHRAGWTAIPVDKRAAVEISEMLEAVLVNLQVVRKLGKDLPKNSAELDNALAQIRQTINEIEALVSRDSEIQRQLAQIQTRLVDWEKRAEALDGLAALVASGVENLSIRVSGLRESIGRLSNMVTGLDSAVSAISIEDMGSKMVSSAIRLAETSAETAQIHAKQANEALSAFERGQSTLRAINQRLQHAAREVLSHSGDMEHCPLCHTAFEKGELLKRIEASIGSIADEESAALRNEATAANDALTLRAAELAGLRALERVVDNPKRTSVSQAIARASGLRAQLSAEQAELEALEQQIAALRSNNVTLARLHEMKTAARLDDAPLSLQSLEEVRIKVNDDRKKAAAAIPLLEIERRNLANRVSEIARPYGMSSQPSEALSGLRARATAMEDLQRAFGRVAASIRWDPDVSDVELEARISLTTDLVVQLKTSLAQEASHSAQLAKELEIEKDALDTLAGLRVKLKRIEAAERIIGDLLTDQSERTLTEQILRENAAKISDTFARIHAPSEFDLIVNGNLRIVRRSDKNDVDLAEMSSGQRAAYVLSLFLAMNERLQNGPKVLLFDDPVAHADDINALSFLDHLRQIALSNARQIFFATADSKLAGLFRHKFAFMGDERFKEFELTRAHA
jgi:DNA repair protein SbcC/Rad50